MVRPRVSILMPFRNTAEFLPECLASIRAQTATDWELLAVDDGSADASRDIVCREAQKDSRIRILSNPGSGIIPALREAYRVSRGAYITRMDSDDMMPPERLEHMSARLFDAGTGHIAIGAVRYFSHRGISDGYARYEAWLNRLTRLGDNFREIYKECAIPSPCWMVFREDLDRCGAFGPDRYPEDYDLAFRFYQNRMVCLPEERILLHWRDYDSRTSRTSEHYAQNYFLDIKAHYFLRIDRDPERELVIWGAGYKGKFLARYLRDAGIPFRWICDNPAKIGKRIYGLLLEPFPNLDRMNRPQSLITVANRESQAAISAWLSARGYRQGSDSFFFC